MKKCPFCAEEIQDEAILCRYCGKDLPQAAAQPARNPIEWLGLMPKRDKEPSTATEQPDDGILGLADRAPREACNPQQPGAEKGKRVREWAFAIIVIVGILGFLVVSAMRMLSDDAQVDRARRVKVKAMAVKVIDRQDGLELIDEIDWHGDRILITVRNTNRFRVMDISWGAQFGAPSGTVLGRRVGTIYNIVEPGETKKLVAEVDLVPDQASKVKFVLLGYRR